VVALDANDMETVAGALINRDFLNPLPLGFTNLIRDPSPFAPLINALDIIDEAWFKMHPEIKRDEQDKVADLWMVGVHPEYRDCGIASNLALHSLEHVARAGFEYAIVECTGAFTQRLFKKVGCSPVFALPYKDLLWKGEAVFRNVPPPHTKWEIYEKKL
jgi:ribosomal protein S18 acetylase RimI-like enzyme